MWDVVRDLLAPSNGPPLMALGMAGVIALAVLARLLDPPER